MAMRVKQVRKAQKDQGNCETCGTHVGVGFSYKFAKGRYTEKRVRCLDCPTWSTSELDTSKMATALAGREAASVVIEELVFGEYTTLENPYERFLEDIGCILAACADEASTSRDEYQEGLDNMPEGLQQGPTGEGIQEKIDMLDDWISSLESFDPTEEEPEFTMLEGMTEVDRDEAGEQWAEQIKEEVQAVLDELEA